MKIGKWSLTSIILGLVGGACGLVNLLVSPKAQEENAEAQYQDFKARMLEDLNSEGVE